MSALNPSTCRRLKKLRQVPSIWEGDRRPLVPEATTPLEAEASPQGECILWVDGVEEVVRAMDVVPPEAGPEAIVRTLLRAMENPHGSGARPARPQKILVRDRETQFFLRGVLQDLDIAVDYAAELPLIEEIFRGLQEVADSRVPLLPPELTEALTTAAQTLWQDAPWEVLDEEKVLSVELNYGDVGTLYATLLGMLGMEFGVLLYRSVESLKQFRQRVLAADESAQSLERAFLEQDCFFLTFEEVASALNSNGASLQSPEVEPTFGCLHPLEGLRPVLYEEEAIAVLLALDGLHQFFAQHLDELDDLEEFPALSERYRLPDPKTPKKKVAVTVATMPALAAELYALSGEADLEIADFSAPILRDDLLPNDAFYSLGAMPVEVLEMLRLTAKVHQAAETALPKKLEAFPIILIQTSRPKAMALIEEIQASGGLEAIFFNPGEDPFQDQHYDLGILRTQNGEMHLFGEFIDDDPVHIEARRKWDQRCRKTKGQCGLVVAMGVTGESRGNPQLKDMLGLFEVRSLAAADLGLGTLQLVPRLEL